jgi:pyrroline-5-carboxylate reductase
MKIGLIGCGKMGSAFARQLAKRQELILFDHNLEKAKELASQLNCHYAEQLSQMIQDSEVILLAVKPKDLKDVAKEIGLHLDENALVISMLAGTPLDLLRRRFPKAALIRMMPNLALTCGEGIIGLVDHPDLSELLKRKIGALFHGMGLLLWMSENKIEALTSLTASGIGLVCLMIEAMIDGGVMMGFSAQESRELVIKTLEGTIALLRETGQHPAELKLKISSPGGTTIAGLKEMEDRGVRSGIINALLVTQQRALQIADELRNC